jgi:hypothetical protein
MIGYMLRMIAVVEQVGIYNKVIRQLGQVGE